MPSSGNRDSGASSETEAPSEAAGARPVVRVRAALALERAGELEQAARLFEYVGEHAQAASLRLEHAQTLADGGQRLRVLREGAARNSGETEQGRALHGALASALLDASEALADGPRRRALRIEAARALEESDDGGRAGELFEELGLLERAARSYEAAGAITRLEFVLALLDQRDRLERERTQEFARIGEALDEGRRSLAKDLLAAYARPGADARPEFLRLSADLDARTPRRRRLTLDWTFNEASARLQVCGTPELRIGRAPTCEVLVPDAALSREHASIRVEDGELAVLDLGSHAGTFLDGIALEPGIVEPIAGQVELGLGLARAIQLHVHADQPVLHLRHAADPTRPWLLFAPLGSQLLVDPHTPCPATLTLEADAAVLQVDDDVLAWLGETPLGPGACVEVLLGDWLRLETPKGTTWTLSIAREGA